MAMPLSLTIQQDGLSVGSTSDLVETSVSQKNVASVSQKTVSSSQKSLYWFSAGSIQETIATTLEIPVHLTDRTNHDLHMSYAKYLAFLEATKTLSKMTTEDAWPHGKLTNDDIIEVFVSKSAYFRSYAKIFPLVKQYPAMQKWLQNEDGAPLVFEVWGNMKQNFENLKVVLDNFVNASAKKDKKGKGKSHEKVSAKSASGSKRQL